MYKFKEAARRGSALFAAASLLAGIGASAMPALVSADALNPLTERSLTLSSSSPGWSYKDGSGNTKYAPPNSGANGQKTGETFSFKTSTDNANIKAFTFQFCTKAAGDCLAPGDNGYVTGTPDTRAADGATTSDLNVVASSPSEISDWSTIQARTSTGNPGVEFAKTPLADNSEGNYIVLVDNVQSTGWTMTTGNNETGTVAADTATGKNNLITLTHAGQTINANQTVKVIFFATNTNYITNPGEGAFFVKINDYDIGTNTDVGQPDDGHALDPTQSSHIVDGGVTVANVMNESISIQTKVLETMDFSVGTVDPDTLTAGASSELATATASARTAHGPCDPVLTGLTPTAPHNVLYLGDTTAENSLDTSKTYATHSYWRLSSNSSGGATVYYTGHTLTNTEDDQIAPVGTTKAAPLTGAPQFGIAIDNDRDSTTGPSLVDYAGGGNAHENGADLTVASHGQTLDSGFSSVVTAAANPEVAHNPQLFPLVADTQYADGKGNINATDGTIDTKFAFDANADSSAVPIASESAQVVNCVTAKMRYMANIAATTPAGIYTTKINYVASPQY